METTKFTVIFNDANNTVLFTNDIEKSTAFAELSKKFNYRIINNDNVIDETDKEETETGSKFNPTPFVVDFLNQNWQNWLIEFAKMDKELQKSINSK